MSKEKFGVAVDEETVQEVDGLVAECDDLGAPAPPLPTTFSQRQLYPTNNLFRMSGFINFL